MGWELLQFIVQKRKPRVLTCPSRASGCGSPGQDLQRAEDGGPLTVDLALVPSGTPLLVPTPPVTVARRNLSALLEDLSLFLQPRLQGVAASLQGRRVGLRMLVQDLGNSSDYGVCLLASRGVVSLRLQSMLLRVRVRLHGGVKILPGCAWHYRRRGMMS